MRTLRASHTALCSLTKRACKVESPHHILVTSPETGIPSWSWRRSPSSEILSFPSLKVLTCCNFSVLLPYITLPSHQGVRMLIEPLLIS
ncbi:hypothetical protein PanWU01x14_311110 [Parasponia andersonii]|uniref:Uncharacterized protein n=1 Tax=Parasponia andersonii TaxID=3476 RepID=A0A2P5AQ15_PARAD|nr:hypothetical protein PanWU01x14_311110 [Parasponia andersonii]